MTFSPITEFELELIQATAAGKNADFRNRVDPTGKPLLVNIRGDVLRRLLFGLPLPARADDSDAPTMLHTVSGGGICIQGAHIQGALDIIDASQAEGRACPPLLLEDCLLAGDDSYAAPSGRPGPALNARHARLARLALKNCRCGFIDLTNAVLLGDLDLDGLQAPDEGGQCRIEAAGLRIEGSLRAPDAKLRLKQATVADTSKVLDYALNLAGAEITGAVHLRPRFVADGGISLASAKIRGDFWADGARLIAQGNYALRGQGVNISGIVGLTCLHTRPTESETEQPQAAQSHPERFTAEGAVSFLGADLGSLSLTGARLLRKPDATENWLSCDLAEIRHTVFLNKWTVRVKGVPSWELPFEADYDVLFRGTKVSGSINARGSKIADFHGEDLDVGGNLTLTGIEARRILLAGADVRGDLDLTRLSLLDGGPLPELNLEHGHIDRGIKIASIDVIQELGAEWAKASPVGVRRRKLACYNDAWLYQSICPWKENDGEGLAIVSFVLSGAEGQQVLLDGTAKSIWRLNHIAGLRLDTPEQAALYLKLFCGYVWADEGRFRIVESADEIRDLTQTNSALPEGLLSSLAPKRSVREEPWSADANLVYGGKLFKASFRIGLQGLVDMLEDDAIADLPGTRVIKYTSPFEIIQASPSPSSVEEEEGGASSAVVKSRPIPSPFDPVESWEKMPGEKLNELAEIAAALVESRARGSKNPDQRKAKVILKGLKVGSLDDNYGGGWGEQVILNLDGFVYERFEDNAVSVSNDFGKMTYHTLQTQLESLKGRDFKTFFRKQAIRLQMRLTMRATASQAWKMRLEWLEKQYEKDLPLSTEQYRSQPYEQVSRVLRAQGDSDGAAHVLVEKMRVERKIRFPWLHWKRLGYWLMDRCFGYGVFWVPALRTFLLCWVIGWLGVDFANNGNLRWPPVGSHRVPIVSFLRISSPILVVDTASVSTLALTENTLPPNDVVARGPATLLADGGFVTEIRCGEQIEPALYALDVFVPLLDLRQESKCAVSSADYAWPWRIAKSLYAILGWIVTSALILTMSGLVRREIER